MGADALPILWDRLIETEEGAFGAILALADGARRLRRHHDEHVRALARRWGGAIVTRPLVYGVQVGGQRVASVYARQLTGGWWAVLLRPADGWSLANGARVHAYPPIRTAELVALVRRLRREHQTAGRVLPA